MSDPVGSRIPGAVRTAAAAGLPFAEASEAGVLRFNLDADRYRAEVWVEPGRALGMALEVRPREGRSLTYEFDNDLYDIASDRFRDLGAALEADIVAFVERLAGREVLVGTVRGKLTLVIPQSADIAVVTRRRLGTVTQNHQGLELPPLAGSLLPLQDWDG